MVPDTLLPFKVQKELILGIRGREVKSTQPPWFLLNTALGFQREAIGLGGRSLQKWFELPGFLPQLCYQFCVGGLSDDFGELFAVAVD